MQPTAPDDKDDPGSRPNRRARQRWGGEPRSVASQFRTAAWAPPAHSQWARRLHRRLHRSAHRLLRFLRAAATFATTRAVLMSVMIVLVLPPLTLTCPSQP